MSAVLVFSESTEGMLELLAGGRSLADSRGGSLAAAVVGPEGSEIAAAASELADRTYLAAGSAVEEMTLEDLSAALTQGAEAAEAELVLVTSTRRGRAVAPLVAYALDAACVTDARDVTLDNDRLVTSRLALGGNTLKVEAILADRAVVAVAPGAFEAGGSRAEQLRGAETVELALDLPEPRVSIVERREKPSGAVNIEDAERLVCIGRGVANQEDLAMIEVLAEALGAEVAATRPLAYEYNWLPEDRMVGISGKTVSPELYVVVGSSGQIQHTVSVRDSRVIVAVNKDGSAPIFEMADYGIVGDLYEVVPMLTEALEDAK